MTDFVPECSVAGCDSPAKARGWCNKHYLRWWHHGDPETALRTHEKGPAPERFWPKVNKDGPVPDYRPDLGRCWLWTGATCEGYGRFRIEGATYVGAHRYAYEIEFGQPVPEGFHLDHLCRVRHCVNPSHLEPVTPRENILRGVGASAQHARKTHCIRGHEFTPENTGRTPSGARTCRACHSIRNREYRQRKQEAA